MSGKEKLQNWIKSHDPELDWNWSDLSELKLQFEDTISTSGNLDIVGLFECVPKPFDYSKYSDEMLHQMRMHPDYEYKTTEGPRKRWDDEMRPPDDDDSWQVNIHAGYEGWERFDYTEERYWKRPKLLRTTSDETKET